MCITTVLVAFEFQHRGTNSPGGSVALFPGAWNPPTLAHVAIANAALKHADEVIWVIPKAFPHKSFEGASFEARLEMLCAVAGSETGFSVAVSDGGLYLEIADAARGALGPEPEIALVCGRDAAERIAAWDYGRPGVFEETIARFPLWVAGRAGEYLHAAEHAGRIRHLTIGPAFDEVSSSEIRRRIAAGEACRHLLPDSIAGKATAIYGKGE